MTYDDVLVIIVVINAIVTLSLWRWLDSKTNKAPTLGKKNSAAFYDSKPIVPKHDPQKVTSASENDKIFFADFNDFADVINWYMEDIAENSFRLQERPDKYLRLKAHDMPILGRSFAIYFNQALVGRLEVSARHDYTEETPEVYTDVEIFRARFFGFDVLTEFLRGIAVHVVTNNDEGHLKINAALTRTLWDYYTIAEYDKTDDWGELTVSFQGNASWYIGRRDAPARPRSR